MAAAFRAGGLGPAPDQVRGRLCAGMTGGVAAFTNIALIPGGGGGRIMGLLRSLRVAPWKRYLVARAGLQLGRGYAIAATGLPVAA